jgi:type IV pilus assembly protein PilB
VIAVMAQRLIRVICTKCKQPVTLSDAVLAEYGITPEMAETATFMKGKGCGHCNKSGYRGRMGIYELMMMTSKVRELSFKGAGTQDIRKAAIANGMKTLYQDGIAKVMKGVTTLEEVARIAKRTD